MYEYLFSWICSSSFLALPYILFFIILRAVFSVRISPIALLLLYVLALFKILSPIHIKSSFSIQQFLVLPMAIQNKISHFVSMNQNFLLVSWSVGFVLIIGIYTWVYFHGTRSLCKNLQDTCPNEIHVLANDIAAAHGFSFPVQLSISNNLNAPVLCRLTKPVVVLPKTYLEKLTIDDFRYILAHEFAHLKSHDILCSLMMSAIVALFWFNPFIWVLSAVFKSDREIIADQCALSGLNITERLAYGQCLLTCAELSVHSNARSSTYALPSFSYAFALKRRMNYILQNSPVPTSNIVISSLLFVSALLIFFPDPSVSNLINAEDYISPVTSVVFSAELKASAQTGVYLENPNKNPIRASRSGIVEKIGFSDDFGNFIVLNHGNNVFTLYGHLNSTYRSIGQNIAQGQIVGYSAQQEPATMYFQISDKTILATTE